MLNSLKKEAMPLKTQRNIDNEYVAHEQNKILPNEEIYIVQNHKNEKLVELDMFYKQRREIK